MYRKRRNQDETEDLNITNAFTDLMSNAFMILSFFLILATMQIWQGNKENLELISRTENMSELLEELNNIREENKQLASINEELRTQNESLYNTSPIIIDEKSGNFQFPSGSAELTSELRNYITNTVAPQINQIINSQDIDFIQVIGHTDGQVLGNVTSNLDQNLERVAQNQISVTQLTAGSNADLALMRALAVVQELQRQGEFRDIQFRAYSGAQLYLPSGGFAPVNRSQDDTRRRMEIRFIPPGRSNTQSDG